MPTCKENCLCYESCKNIYEELTGDKGTGGNAEYCKFFKDRSKFVELQCKPGDIVYHYCDELHEILEYTIYCVDVFRENGITYHSESYDEENDKALSEIGFEPEDIGRDVFFTREEAEQALKERDSE